VIEVAAGLFIGEAGYYCDALSAPIESISNLVLNNSINFGYFKLNSKLFAAHYLFYKSDVNIHPDVRSSVHMKLISPIIMVYTFHAGFQVSGW